MKDLMKNRLNRIENLNDRMLLKQIINGVFMGLVDYTDEQLEAIRLQVFNEIEDEADQFDIYYDILQKDEIDPISEFFFPIEAYDLNEAKEMSAIAEQISSTPEAFISKVYLDCDYLKFKRFIEESKERSFRGEIETTEKTYSVDFSISQYQGYIDKLEELYVNFINNNLPWKTVLHPHLYKFIGIYLKAPLPLAEKEAIKKITFNLEEMQSYQRIDYVPLWNVQILNVKNESFAVPAQDHINFLHTINLDKYGIQHGYLIDTRLADIDYVRKTDRAMTIVSPNEKVLNWRIYQLLQPDQKANKMMAKSNHREDSFTDRFARRENFTIRSMCEISRIINSFSMMENFALEETEILTKLPMVEETYEVNPFLEDHIRDETNRKPMLLKFTAKQHTTLTRDELSFLVSEIQLHFPEFKCIGELR